MLKNDIPEIALFYDLEWVPDAAGAKRIYDLPDETTEIEGMQELWRRTGGYDEEKNPRPFVKYLLSRVVSIAFLSRKVVYRDGEKTIELSLNSLPKLPLESDTVDEAQIIERFLYIVGTRRPQLVGFNSAESDMQVLIQRGLVNEVSAAPFCRRPERSYDPGDYFKKWDNEDHLDLLTRFSNRSGMAPRLDELAKLFGYPGKIDLHGDQVVDLWLAGDVKRIVEYNQIDTLNTYLVWLRLIYFCGKMEEEEYFREHQQFRDFLEAESAKPEKAFVQQFLEKWEL